MTLTEKALAVLLMALALITGFYGIKRLGVIDGRAEVQALWDKDKIARSDAMLSAVNQRIQDNAVELKAQQDNNDLITKGKDNEIAKVTSDLNAIKRLRVGPSFCPSNRTAAKTDPQGTGSSNAADTGTGLLSESLDSRIRQLILQSEEAAATGRAAQKFILDNGFSP